MMIRFYGSSLAACLAALVLGSLFSVESVHAQRDDDSIRTADYDVQSLSYPSLRDFEVPSPRRIELDNGMVVFLLEDHELPQVNAVARVGTGSVYEPAEKRGLASITGTVMRTGGTDALSPDSLNQTLENIGATVETGIGETSGSAFMSTLSEHMDTVLPVFADVLRQPAFAKMKVQQAKKQQKSAISRRNDNAQDIAFREFDKLVYGEKSPYARTPEYYTIDRISRTDLVDFHDQYFHPSNVLLSVWGDFDADSMAAKIRRQFGEWTAAEEVESPTPPQPTVQREYSVNLIPKTDVNQSTILMGHPGRITRDDPDYPAVTVMNEVLSGGFSGRLFQSVRREKGLAYSVFGGYSANYDRPGRFYAGVFSKSATTVEAANAVLHEVERMREAAPTEGELGLAKDSYLNSFVFNFDTKREILSRLMTYEAYDYPSDFLQQTKDGIETVTAGDVQSVAKEYLHPEETHILVVGNRNDFSDSLSTLTKDGSVNEIDISIPTRPASERDTVTAADKKAGLAVLRNVKQALGGTAFGSVQNMKVVSRQTAQTSRGKMTIDLTSTRDLPDKFYIERSMPQGTIEITINGNKGQMKTPRGTQAMPASLMKRFKGQLWRDLTYLMTHLEHDGLSAQDLGSKTVDDTTYRAVEVAPPTGNPFTLYLDPSSMRPARMSFQAQTRQGPKPSSAVYRNYTSVNGMTIPFTTITYQDGEKRATTKIREVSVNEDLQSGLFKVGGSSSE